MGRKRVPGLIMRSGKWHIDKHILGRRICQSTGTDQLEEAERRLARVMEENPPAQEDGPALEKLKRLGIEPCKEFNISEIDPAIARALERAVKDVGWLTDQTTVGNEVLHGTRFDAIEPELDGLIDNDDSRRVGLHSARA